MPKSEIEAQPQPLAVEEKSKEEQVVDSNAISVSNMREYEE